MKRDTPPIEIARSAGIGLADSSDEATVFVEPNRMVEQLPIAIVVIPMVVSRRRAAAELVEG